jgi:DNA-binding response OmpR family regulator
MEAPQKTILLVEDQALIALSEAKALRAEGYAVVHAYSGDQAVGLMDDGAAVDLILMDIDLGAGMDGTEAARAILERHQVPVVFLSAHMEKDIVLRTEGITNYGYIVKNLSPTVLFASIKMAFKLHQAHRKLEHRELHYGSLFNATTQAVVEEDFSAVKAFFAELRAAGEDDLRSYFAAHPESLIACTGLVRIVDFNDEYMRLQGARTREEVSATLAPYISPAAAERVLEELFALDEGRTPFVREFRNEFASIPDQYIRLKLSPVTGHKDDWSRVLVSLADITGEKRTEERLAAALRENEALERELSLATGQQAATGKP